MEDFYVQLAIQSLEKYILEKKILGTPEDTPPELLQMKAGAFVSIKKNGMLRGCIGTIAATKRNVAEEIIHNAVSAGTKDPRFPPVTEDELCHLTYSVDVLMPAEKIEEMSQLDVKKYGVIVTSGYRRGLLLPDLEGVDTPRQQVEIALEKAGIGIHERFEMERFEVIRHGKKQ